MEQVEKDTGVTPKALLNKPELTQWETVYYEMFTELSGSRMWTMGGPAEIPYSVKLQWLDENQIRDHQERCDYLTALRALDTAYIEHVTKKPEK